ncbi:hypothetical protein [Thermofilum sp.]|uniref:hypothetical protein n=1 Tax=Thermofilum sp. TaxID=1961369 RepID=UPI00316DE43E
MHPKLSARGLEENGGASSLSSNSAPELGLGNPRLGLEAKVSQEVKVYFRKYGCLFFAKIIPIQALPYRPPRQYYGSRPNGEIRKVAEPVFLPNRGVCDVRICLEIQGLQSYDYITPATVHGEWKKQLHQGIIYATSLYNITHAANPYKPFPSSTEVNELFEKLLNFFR